MAVYIVTGKLGSGKSLLACMKIQEYLKRRCPVAVNFNLDLEKNSFCRPINNYSRVLRLPDMPSEEDLVSIGFGNDKYDEEKFGGVFLDEAGIWLNSRQWNSGGRTDILKFFLYIRKRRWDLWLIVQNLDIVDKQIRAAIAEHVVYCSRSDRYSLPIFPKLVLNVFTLGMVNFIKIPKFHTAICKYGVSQLSPVAETWYYKGEDFFGVYNTMQEFNKDYVDGIYSILPPFYTLPIRYNLRKQFREYLLSLPSNKPPICIKDKVMRLTKIYFKKVKAFFAFGSGFITAFILCSFLYFNYLKPGLVKQDVIVKDKKDKFKFDDLLKTAKIKKVDYLPNVGYKVDFISDTDSFTLEELKNNGYVVLVKDVNQVYISSGSGLSFTIIR